jgi:hypothetical protein
MKWRQLLKEVYVKLSQSFEEVLDGLTVDDLHKSPAPDANNIGWLLWHATRSLDRTVGDVILGEQLWIRDGWHARFHRKPDLNETGVGHSFRDVAEFRVPDIETLRKYHQGVMEKSVNYLDTLSENELDREFDNSLHPGKTTPVHLRIVGNINDCFQHVGQAAYVRGLLKGQGWLGR